MAGQRRQLSCRPALLHGPATRGRHCADHATRRLPTPAPSRRPDSRPAQPGRCALQHCRPGQAAKTTAAAAELSLSEEPQAADLCGHACCGPNQKAALRASMLQSKSACAYASSNYNFCKTAQHCSRGIPMPYVSKNYLNHPDTPIGQWACAPSSSLGHYASPPTQRHHFRPGQRLRPVCLLRQNSQSHPTSPYGRLEKRRRREGQQEHRGRHRHRDIQWRGQISGPRRHLRRSGRSRHHGV